VEPPEQRGTIDRRTLLARAAAVGLTAVAAPPLVRAGGGLIAPGVAGARAAAARVALPATLDIVVDTFSGVAAFVVPGDDEFSRQQGVAPPEPGGVAAETPAFLAETLNVFLPAPDVAAFLIEALELRLAAVPLPDGLHGASWLEAVLEHDGTVPLAPLIAGVLNLLAVEVDPASAAGPFLTPFARLSFANKARVWEEFEVNLPQLFTFGAPGSLLPTLSLLLPLLGTLGSLLRFASGALLELAAFGSYTEHAVFDSSTGELTGRPVGWDRAACQPDGPVEGWDEFCYYQDRTQADA
jgi:hypothetical protein